MGYPTKIATCCHCGATTTLTLDTGRHLLSCANCGAPLRDLKMLPKAATKSDKKAEKKARKKAKAISHLPVPQHFPDARRADVARKPKPRKVKKRKGWFKDLAEDVFDLVEDIFD